MHFLRRYVTDAMKRLPQSWLVVVGVICVLPSLLNVVGVSFASPDTVIDFANASAWSPEERTDALHRALSGSFTHTVLEWAAFFTAFVTFVLTVAHFHLTREATTIIIGIALLCSGVMDAFHVLAADRLVYAVSENREFIPFTWAISRLFNATILIAGTILVMEAGSGRVGKGWSQERIVIGVSVGFALVAYGVIYLCANSPSLPTTQYPNAILKRPYDVLPLVLFGLGGMFVFPRFYRRHPNLFSHALLVSVAPQIGTQLHMAFGSRALYDNHFNIAHGLKLVAYGVPLAGLVFDYIRTYREVQSINDELENRVEERTRALSLANQAAESASRAKSDFLANMSHELRTPLNGILGYAQILERDDELTAKQRDGARVIRTCGDHLLSLINEVLDLSKIESGRLELQSGELGLRVLLDDVASIVRVRAEEKGLDFQKDVDPNVPVGVRGDEQRLRQVLLNLLGNAVKFTDEGSLQFVVDVGAGDTIRFRVQDTGMGIAPAEAQTIFEPFHQLAATGSRPDGTGLGLSISRMLVELMGGQLRVHSESSQGSTFEFELELPAVGGWQQGERSTGTPIVGIDGDPPRILIVDDNRDNRAILRDMLEALGFQVAEAVDGQGAIRAVEASPPDLVFMDLVMPVMDGFEAVRQLRKGGRFPGLVIVAVSASVFEHNREGSREAGCDAFLAKPLRTEVVVETIGEHLDVAWRYKAAAERAALPEVVGTLEKQDAASLHALALAGDIQGIHELLDSIEKGTPEAATAVRDVRELARRFELKDIRDYLGSYLEAGS